MQTKIATKPEPEWKFSQKISKKISQNLANFPPIIGGMDLVIYSHIHFLIQLICYVSKHLPWPNGKLKFQNNFLVR